MSVDLVRIDNRLIHGQVIEAWVPHVHADRILVVDDTVSSDPLQRAILELATPRQIKLDICTVEEAVALYREDSFREFNTIVLFANPAEAYAAYSAGFGFTTLNVGNLHYAEGKERVTPSVCCDRSEMDILRRFAQSGVVVEIRAVPRDTIRRISPDGNANAEQH